MATATYYFLTAVWWENYTTKEHATHALIHEVSNNRVQAGVKRTKADIFLLINTSNVYTATWDYTNGGWNRGALVNIERVNNIDYIRSRPDRTAQDNLKNLLSGANIYGV